MGLKKIARAWAACDKCALRLSRNRVVFGERYGKGEGPRLLIIGEAPGAQEDEEGRPFVGQSGKMLRNEYLKPAGVNNAFITNTVACRPSRNRNPMRDEMRACRPRLEQIIEEFQPEMLLEVGRVSEANRVFIGDRPRVAVYHPAYVLRKGWPGKHAREIVEKQVEKIKNLLLLGHLKKEEPASLKPVPVIAGQFLWEGEWYDDLTIDKNTGLIIGIPRKPTVRSKK